MKQIMIKNLDKKNRIDYIDVVKGIGILLVVLGHLLPYGNVVKTAIYVIHMPLFFFVSGMVLKEYQLKVFFSKRSVQILIPYFLWATIFAQFSIKNILYIVYATNETLRLAGSSGMLWFLSVMFMASLIVQIVLKLSKQNKIVLTISVPFFLIVSIVSRMIKYRFIPTYGLPFAFDVTCLATAFILTGWLLLPFINKMIEGIKISLLALISVLTMGVSFLGIFLKTNKGSPQMATLDVGNIIAYYLLAIVAIVGAVFVSVLIDKYKPNYIYIYIVWLGRNSLTFFVTHRILLYQCQDYYFTNPTLLVLFAMFVLLMIATTAITFVVSHVLPVLTGK